MAKLYLGSSLIGGEGGGAWNPPDIDKTTGTYSQSSVYSGNAAAEMAAMTSDTVISSTQTATNAGVEQFVKVDYGSVQGMKKIRVRCPNNELTGGWGTTLYIRQTAVEVSADDSLWTRVGILMPADTAGLATLTYSAYMGLLVPGAFTDIILPAFTEARWIRVVTTISNYLALTGLYAV